MKRPATRATLEFPFLFSPNGVGCSFGDANGFQPLAFHAAAAQRLGRANLLGEFEAATARGYAQAQKAGAAYSSWPNEAELLLLRPRLPRKAAIPLKRHALMADLEWGYVADRMPRPRLYLSVRGGALNAPHSHHDLMSFHCVAGSEHLIDNVSVDDYIDTLFSRRRFELYETSARSKNTIFVNGAGIAPKSSVRTELISFGACEGFRIDATRAMNMPGCESTVSRCIRLVLLLNKSAVLIVDRIELPHPGLVESRLHTFARAAFKGHRVRILGKTEKMSAYFAASQPALVARATGEPTCPQRQPDTMIRHLSSGKVRAITLACLLVPNGKGSLALDEKKSRTTIRAAGRFRAKLQLAAASLRLLR